MTVSNDYFSLKASRNQLHSCMTIGANAKVFHHTNDSCFISCNKSESNSHFLTVEEQSLFLFLLFNVEKYLSGACNMACPLQSSINLIYHKFNAVLLCPFIEDPMIIALQATTSRSDILLKTSAALPKSPHLQYISTSAVPITAFNSEHLLSIYECNHFPVSRAPACAQAESKLARKNLIASLILPSRTSPPITRHSTSPFLARQPKIVLYMSKSLTGAISKYFFANSKSPALTYPRIKLDNIAYHVTSSLSGNSSKTCLVMFKSPIAV
ncbi:hypothetical protein H5410_053556 [Solanum commersonii]|uniref:Uncharacterized protein n=1 Tax=Solanum commersonii TaxID=4109 RepID=A0A9J5X3U3_SOLCO|nr:hypothetical protein H5410_053556 [Solanum commersonii]